MSSRVKVSSGSEPSSRATVPTMPPVLESPVTGAETVQPRTRPGPSVTSSASSEMVSSGSSPRSWMAWRT